MKRLLFLLCTTILFSACGNKDEEPKQPEKPQAPVTVWAYFVADTNIKSDIRNNIKTMYEGLSKMEQQATMLVYWDGGSSESYINYDEVAKKSYPCILRYTTDGYGNINGTAARDSSYSIRIIAEAGEVVKEYDSQLSTDKNVMTSVLKDMSNFSPTRQIAMVAGSHGSAWTNSIFTQTRSFGQDGSGTNNTITTDDMAEAIQNAGIHLDLLLFDACLMGTIEVCYDFRNVTNYMIVSPIEAPAPGFPFKDLMNDIYQGTRDSYRNVCVTGINHYMNRTDGYDWSAISLIDCKQIENLTSLIKKEITEHKDFISSYNPINKLQQYGVNEGVTSLERNFYYVSFDIMQFMDTLNNNSIPNDLSAQYSKTVLYADCLENSINYPVVKANYCGLGMYIPVKERPKWNTYFKTIDWYKAAGWNEVTFSWDF